ncbi:transporter [Ruegeria arenilitoris]|uniref:transporter n=1 Tax=Ruegeria arenilitoris TaxID=1173585 RepID=UPI001582E40D|nr:transporter [Ruegeria arenilitoris]
MSFSNISQPTKNWRTYAPVISFCASIFVSASLLFFVQPLFAKLVLPKIGGTPAVWTTAMLFFQLMLILGYLYAHMLTRWFTLRWQLVTHLALWLLALGFLPLATQEGWRFDSSQSIALQTLLLFAAGVGVPFAVLSANAPLLQAWYSRSGGPSANDPYFLYAASNVGSLLALLAFPLIADPFYGARDISLFWSIGFVVFGVLLATSGVIALRGAPDMTLAQEQRGKSTPLNAKTIATWVFIAFVPSSLMLATTTKLSIDLGSIPLIWVVPLATYILTFILAFAKRQPNTLESLKIPVLFAMAIGVALLFRLGTAQLPLAAMLVYIPLLYLVAMFAHRLLYEMRPPAEHLTTFYLALSVGGACGGLFNSIIAPAVFDREIEFALTLLAAGGLFLIQSGTFNLRKALLGVAVAAPLAFLLSKLNEGNATDTNTLPTIVSTVLVAGVLLCFRNTPTRMAAALLVLLVPTLIPTTDVHFRDRSFFGTHAVYDRDGFRVYKNGTTIHGGQRLTAPGIRPVGSSYYHPDGPMAEVLTSEYGQTSDKIGIVGLGTGALACYRQPHQTWEFFEIDETVDRIARDPALFTYMSDCASGSTTHLGDARIVLAHQKFAFDIMVLDAYSSDAIPLHLITLEAIQTYMSQLNRDGTLVFHISNKYYDLAPQLARAADTLGLHAAIKWGTVDEEAQRQGAANSLVAILSRDEYRIDAFVDTRGWHPLIADGQSAWTDDKANLLSALRMLAQN